MPQFFKNSLAVTIIVLTQLACGTGMKIAERTKPSGALMAGADNCSNKPTTEKQEACLVGVLAERDVEIAAAKAAADTVKDDQYLPYGYGSSSGVVQGYRGPYIYPTPIHTTGTGRVGGYNKPAPTPKPK